MDLHNSVGYMRRQSVVYPRAENSFIVFLFQQHATKKYACVKQSAGTNDVMSHVDAF